MAYTFGAGTGDDINYNTGITFGNDDSTQLIAGWFYPTTLTATRGLWSFGNTYGAQIASTTSELLLRTDNTTDGEWETSGLGLVTNKWQFIACLNACENTTVDGAWRVWIGDAEAHPAEVTVTSTVTRSGNYTGNSTLYIGNIGTGTVAFEGDIGWLSAIRMNAARNITFTISATGVIEDSEAENTLRRVVHSLWLGTPVIQMICQQNLLSSWTYAHIDLNQTNLVAYQHTSTDDDCIVVPTINGATYTEHRPPKVFPVDTVFRGSHVRCGSRF